MSDSTDSRVLHTVLLRQRSYCVVLSQAMLIIEARKRELTTVEVRSIDHPEPITVRTADVMGILTHDADNGDLVDLFNAASPGASDDVDDAVALHGGQIVDLGRRRAQRSSARRRKRPEASAAPDRLLLS
jgi:hypothetical protein